MEKLEEHLSVPVHNGYIEILHADKILPGTDEKFERSAQLKKADIILLIVSPTYTASYQCYDVEATQAVQMANAGIAHVRWIPYRHVLHEEAVFSHCPNLLKDGKFVHDWPNKDKPLMQICQEIDELVSKALSDRQWREENRVRFGNRLNITHPRSVLPPLPLKRHFKEPEQGKKAVIQSPQKPKPQKPEKPIVTPASPKGQRNRTSSRKRKTSSAGTVTHRASGQSSILAYKPIKRKFSKDRGTLFIILFIFDVVAIPLTMRRWWDSWVLVGGVAALSFLIFAWGTVTTGSFIPVLLSFLMAAIWGSIIVQIFSWPPASWALLTEIGGLIVVALIHYFIFRRR